MSKEASRVHIIVAGLEHVRHGFASLANGLRKQGINTLFYSQGIAGVNTEQYAVANKTASRHWLADVLSFARLLRRYRPRHVEVYLHYGSGVLGLRNFHSIAHVLIATLMRIPIVLFCTGGEILYWERHNWLRRFTVRFAIARAKVVVIKELYMADYMSQYRIGDTSKTVFIHNHITVRNTFSVVRKTHQVLFLNSFKSWRHVDLVVKAAQQVLQKVPDARFALVGARSVQESTPIEALIQDLGCETEVKVHPWVKDGTAWYEASSVFVLPADVVFCNNALLEAMERGTPPIVADVPGADRIVVDGESGLLVPQTVDDLANAIICLLVDENLRRRLAEGARAKILTHFAEDLRARKLLEMYETKIWG